MGDSLDNKQGKITLLEHRKKLKNNTNVYTEDIPRCYKSVVSHLKTSGYKKITFKRAEKEIKKFVNLIFKAQNFKPYFEFGEDLPFAWNSPMKNGWKLNYIKYEWGHLNSRNQNGHKANDLKNLCLQSARCNQHIQASLNIDELKEYGGNLKNIIELNESRRNKLFNSSEWEDLIKKLEKWKLN